MNITEEKESQFLTTFRNDDSDHDLGKSLNGTSEAKNNAQPKSKTQNKLNSLVTKVDPFAKVLHRNNQNNVSQNEHIIHEQGQNSGDEDNKFTRSSIMHEHENIESDERLIGKYVEHDPSNSKLSISRSDQSQLHSSLTHEGPPHEVQDEEEHQSELHKAHLIQTLQAIQYIKSLPTDHSLDGKYVNLPPHHLFDSPETTKTIIFDLDETLVHCVDEPETDNPHVILKVTFPTGETVDAGINVRPYALECLKEANKYFQVVVFTASHQSYADVVLDYLDPNRELIQYRLYRES